MASLVVVGSVAYDSVETPFGKVEEALGGAATYASMAAACFTEVRIVGAVGNDFRQGDLSLLESRNIDLAGLDVLPGLTFRWSGHYGDDLNDWPTSGPTFPSITGAASTCFWGISIPLCNEKCSGRSGNPNWLPATP